MYVQVPGFSDFSVGATLSFDQMVFTAGKQTKRNRQRDRNRNIYSLPPHCLNIGLYKVKTAFIKSKLDAAPTEKSENQAPAHT